MSAKPALIAAGIIGTLALGTGGYIANEWRVCSGLEADYLSTIESYTSNVQAGALAGAVGVEVDEVKQSSVQDLSLRAQKMQLINIYKRCGDDAGRAAADQASTNLFEG